MVSEANLISPSKTPTRQLRRQKSQGLAGSRKKF